MRSHPLFALTAVLLCAACGDNRPAPTISEPATPASEPPPVILVTGATGRQGGAVARALLERGHAVRAMTRRPSSEPARALAALGATVVRGDFEDPDSLLAALDGTEAAFLVTTFAEAGAEGELRHGRNFIDAAAQASVGHLVFTSAANADREVGISAFDTKHEIELYLAASGVPFTVVRPVSFMDTYLGNYELLTGGKFSDPIDPDATNYWIAVSDIGRIVADVLEAPETWLGQAIDIAGDAMTMRELADTMGHVLGIEMVYSRTPWSVYEARAGPATTRLKRWFESPGYDVDMALVREQFPGLLTFENFLIRAGWADRAARPQPSSENGILKSFSHLTVGVVDMDVALALWVDTFGMEVVAESRGPDAGMATLWDLDPSAIVRQAYVLTPGQSTGGIHLVQFENPGAPVREGAEVFDLLPKNLDVYAEDLRAKYAALAESGFVFRGEPSEVTAPSGVVFREVHMFAHDYLNVVLLEVEGEDHAYTDKGFAGLGPVITIVPDADAEQQFWMNAVGLEQISANLLSGPEVERMVGLPPGSGLDVRIVGDPKNDYGGIEIIEYQGVEGRNLYPLAHPPALGNLHVNYIVQDLGPLRVRLSAAGTAFNDHGAVDTIFGSGRSISFDTPAGLRVEVHERN